MEIINDSSSNWSSTPPPPPPPISSGKNQITSSVIGRFENGGQLVIEHLWAMRLEARFMSLLIMAAKYDLAR